MPFDSTLVDELAGQLDQAERDRKQIPQFSRAYSGMTIDDAYAVQDAWVRRKVAAGQRIIGHKIGLTSRAMQRAVNINEPDYGVLLSPMQFHDGQTIPIDQFIEPRVEVEIAFILKKPLQGPNCTIFDVLNHSDYVVPAVEIIDARIERIDREGRGTRTVIDTISDNAANAGIVMGGRPMRPDAIDLRWVSAILHRNGEIEETGVGAAVLNHPANGPAWLANRLSRFGVSLEAGEIILGGSFTGQVFVRPGDSFHVDFGPMGSIGMRFA